MTTILVRHARVLVTMDAERREIPDGAVLVHDGVIAAVGASDDLPADADRVIDARNMMILPGLVNTHHHFFQSLTRALPAAQDAGLFQWLRTHYPVWARMDAEAIRVSTRLVLAELALSGCTTACDHLYLYPNGAALDDEILAAREIGVRLHACRGSMSMGRSRGGLPPDAVVEDEEAVLRDCERVWGTFHEPQRYGMVRIVIAPCAPFNVSEHLMRRSAEFARQRGLTLHTHVAETLDEEAFCLRRTGMRPVPYMHSLGWTGRDVWWAHVVWTRPEEVALLAETGTGVAHCPSSNMRLGSGIAPIRAYRDAGVRVGLGVDGSASNDSSHLFAEARQAFLLQRVGGGAGALSAREALEIATLGGAAVLGRDDIGALAPGMAADLIGVRSDRVWTAGAGADPVAALVLCRPPEVDLSIINGRVVVEGGTLQTADLGELAARQNAVSERLVNGAVP